MSGVIELGLLLAEADGEASIPSFPGFGVDPGGALGGIAVDRVPNERGDLTGDPSSLADQRWGVVVGPSAGAILDRLAPLTALRAEEQGAPARMFEVPPGLDAAGAAAWVRDVYLDPSVEEEDRPRYLLLAGGPDEVSLELQEALAQHAMVGRVGFRAPDGTPVLEAYRAYAEKVCRAEQATSARAPDAIVYLARDGSRAAAAADAGLVQPMIAAAEKWARRGLAARSVVVDGRSPEPDELVAAARGGAASVLFTVAHGLGAPAGGWRSPVEQRSRQGALVLPRAAPHRPGKVIDAGVAGVGPFLPGGVWFHFGCFGAATPARSDYLPWLSELGRLGGPTGDLSAITASLARPPEPAFVSALPQAALANPEGPLAVLGHVDLLFAYSFLEDGAPSRRRAARHAAAVEPLLRGRRAGVALDVLMRGFRDANNELARLSQEEVRAGGKAPSDPAARAHLFMLRNDLKNFVLLGDPAVRLKVPVE